MKPIQFLGRLYTRLKYLKHSILNTNRYKLTKRIMQYLESDSCDLPIEEKISLKNFLSKLLISSINYLWIKEYHHRYIRILWDSHYAFHYVLHNGKRLYFKKGWSKRKIREMYNGLCVEMDVRSPHAYHAFSIPYRSSDIVADIGAAEGIWALDIAEKVKELYLFECEEEWIEALQATFAPWKDKVHIVNKYITDFSDNKNTTLDDYFSEKNIFPTIIKADVEGAETSLVKGAPILFDKHIHHAILCTYHKPDDFTTLSAMMQNHHFEVQSTDGYMIALYAEPNYEWADLSKIFRKGLIHAYKTEN